MLLNPALSQLGLNDPGLIVCDAPFAQLIESAVANHEGRLSTNGTLVVETDPRGRSPKAKRTVRRGPLIETTWWEKNAPMDPQVFDGLWREVMEHLAGKQIFINHGVLGADENHQIAVRSITTLAWLGAFIRTMCRGADYNSFISAPNRWTLVFAPAFHADPNKHQSEGPTCVALDYGRQRILIVGTSYGGEAKKALFTAMNGSLPGQGVLPMHCSVAIGPSGKPMVIFGLSGTGKTSLSAGKGLSLIGDDEHGWSDAGLFNFEGGVYAKLFGLRIEREPALFSAINSFGSIAENVPFSGASRELDWDSLRRTENTRGCIPLSTLGRYMEIVGSGRCDHADTVVFLSFDAFGVLPPVSLLTPEQAMYYFLSGYTAKVAGTEQGVTSPEVTFSACFGQPFLPLPPSVYGTMLAERLRKHRVRVVLLNTGLNGSGKRYDLAFTRNLLNAAANGQLDGVETVPDPVFGYRIPQNCPGVEDGGLLQPEHYFADANEFARRREALARQFAENAATLGEYMPEAALEAGPRVQ